VTRPAAGEARCGWRRAKNAFIKCLKRLKLFLRSGGFFLSEKSSLEEIAFTTEVEHSLPLISSKIAGKVADVSTSQMNARITRLRAADLFLEACAIESTNDSKIPGLIFEHKLVVNYDGRCFVKTLVRAEKSLSCILKSRLTGSPACSIKNLSSTEIAALEEHVRLLNKSVAKRVGVIINPVYFAP
jgi:hypothetical protein